MATCIDMTGKVCVVTMSTGGIGLAIARHLAVAGAKAVVLNGRDADRGLRTCTAIRALAPEVDATFIQADVLDREAIADLFRTVEARHGGLDCYVGIGPVEAALDPFEAIDPARYARVLEGLAITLMEGCRHAMPLMKRRGGGAIVSILSDAARVPTPGETVIGAALAAAAMFVRTLALEAARHDIRANVVTPSLVRDTGQLEAVMQTAFSRKVFERIAGKAPLGLPSAEDVADLALFLVSPMSKYITGQVISVNGGVSVV
jgi:NAD(P)-dependent dehydrogenase (short-subunit alcohol dehydrogenase family)